MAEAQKTILPVARIARNAVLWLIRGCMTCLMLSAISPAGSAASQKDLVIDAPRPLDELVQLLEQSYGVPVTVEEPVWSGNGTGKASGEQVPDAIYTLKGRMRLVVPADLLPEGRSAFNLATLNAILALYNREGFDPVKFEAVSSEWGFHILPVAFTMDNGDTIVIRSPLDFPVHVENKRRLASEHFRALCEAIATAGGRDIWPWGTWMNTWFAAGGLATRRYIESLDQEQREPYTFAWGVEDATGRSALLDLLTRSSTTLGWTLFCRAVKSPTSFCVLGVHPLQVRERDEQGRPVLDESGMPRLKYQWYDRLGKVPLQAPPITIQ